MSGRNPMISIVIPVHNPGDLLRDCLDSVIGQTYKNLEIIIVNDGSTDDSEDIIKKYQSVDGRIKYYKTNKHNAAFARKVGIELTKGEYVCFVDSDDVVSEGYVEVLLAGIKKYGTSIATVKIAHFFDKSEIPDLPEGTGKITAKPNLLDYFASNYHGREKSKYISQSINAKIFERHLLDGIDYSVVRAAVLEDNYIVPQILKKADPQKIALVDTASYFYRIGQASTMSSALEHTISLSDGGEVTYAELFNDAMEYIKSVYADDPHSSLFIDRVKIEEFYELAKSVTGKNLHATGLVGQVDELRKQIAQKEEDLRALEGAFFDLKRSGSYRLGYSLLLPYRFFKRLMGR